MTIKAHINLKIVENLYSKVGPFSRTILYDTIARKILSNPVFYFQDCIKAEIREISA